MTSHIVLVYSPGPWPKKENWRAYYDGEEERGEYGWGETPVQAVTELLTEFPPEEIRRPENPPAEFPPA